MRLEPVGGFVLVGESHSGDVTRNTQWGRRRMERVRVRRRYKGGILEREREGRRKEEGESERD